MKVNLQPGGYVAAVSGGVDSVALLHMLAELPGLRLTVAHYDHGVRSDSAEDRRLVQRLAQHYNLPFVYHQGQLGPHVSEAAAREARYAFLHRVRTASGASALVTAHHQDDLLETIILNLIRGTGRRGLSSLKSTDVVKRPLLHLPKKELLRYATEHGLPWRDESTNASDQYLRNYVRHYLMPRFAEADRDSLLQIGHRAAELNHEITQQTSNYLHVQPAPATLDRHSFTMLPHAVAREIMGEWLLANTGVELSRKLLERLVIAAKTGRSGTRVDVQNGYRLEVNRTQLKLSR